MVPNDNNDRIISTFWYNILEILPVDVFVLFFVSVSCYILRTMWENGLTEILKMLLLFIVKEEKVKATYNNLLQHSFNAK